MLGFGLTFLIGTALCLAINPNSYTYYFESLAKSDVPFIVINASMPKALSLVIGGQSLFWSALFMFLGAITLAVRTYNKESAHLFITIAYLLPLSIPLAPYAWGHDYVALTPFLIYLVGSQNLLAKLFCHVTLLLYSLFGVLFALNYQHIPGWAFLLPQTFLIPPAVWLLIKHGNKINAGIETVN